MTAGVLARLDEADAGALLARQTQILEQIATGAALAEVLTGIAATLEELVPDCRCSVLLLNRDTRTLHHGAAPSLPAEYSTGIDGLSIGDGAGSCGTAAHTGRPVIASDIAVDPRWADYRGLAGRFGLRACWSTPIRGRDGITGTFAVYHLSPHRPSPREERLVERLTHLASVAIDHSGLLGALAESEERFRRAFEDNAVGMALANLDGSITRVNRAMQALLGQFQYNLIGVRLDELFTRGQASAPTPAGEDYLGQHEEYEATVRTASGRVLDVAVTVSPIWRSGGTPQGLSVNVLDITGRKATERERRRRAEAELARAAAESANRAKTDFVAALGHELRTPLQAITGFTELLSTLPLDDDRRTAALGHISAASDHILTMVNDVLDVARIEARALPVCLSEVGLAPVVAGVLAMVEPLAAASRVSVGVGLSPAALVSADERRLRQVLLNLVSNAIRYNRAAGTVTVGWTVAAGAVRIDVVDTGSGIAPEHVGRLFTPFDRLGRDAEEGVGLGLPLARGLTEAMGGRLEVHSLVGVGTTMTVCLPIA